MNWIPKHEQKNIRDIALSSFLIIWSYAPTAFGFFIYVAFVPQFFLYKRNNPFRSFIYGYIIGLIVNGAVLYWLFTYSGKGFAVLTILNAFQFALIGLIMSVILEWEQKWAILVFPFLWTVIEYSREVGDLAFNWLNVAHTQSYFIYLIQMADIGGIYMIVFWISLINALIFLILKFNHQRRQQLHLALILFLLFAIPLAYGLIRMSEKPQVNGVSVAYIQPDIDPDIKWRSENKRKQLPLLLSLTDSILITSPDLVIWPETSLPYKIKNYSSDLQLLLQHPHKFKYSLLAGVIDFELIEDNPKRYNAAYFISDSNVALQYYRKLRLVPWEEGIPFRSLFDRFYFYSDQEWLRSGKSANVFKFSVRPYRIQFNGDDWQILDRQANEQAAKPACIICYESIFPGLVQEFIDNDAQMIVVITNDGWFDYTSQPFQHMQISRFRAIEQRITVVRCANNGISVFIDPYGRRFCESKLFTRAAAQKVMPLRLNASFYSKYGDWPVIISGIFIISLLILKLLDFMKMYRKN